MLERIDKENYYLDIAQTVAGRGTCLHENRGAIIVKNDEILATGYTGAPRGRKNCTALSRCVKDAGGGDAGLCRSVHAEANAIISAPRRDMLDATIYLACISADSQLPVDSTSCSYCRKLIINSGISKVVCRMGNGQSIVISVRDWIYRDDTLELLDKAFAKV